MRQPSLSTPERWPCLALSFPVFSPHSSNVLGESDRVSHTSCPSRHGWPPRNDLSAHSELTVSGSPDCIRLPFINDGGYSVTCKLHFIATAPCLSHKIRESRLEIAGQVRKGMWGQRRQNVGISSVYQTRVVGLHSFSDYFLSTYYMLDLKLTLIKQGDEGSENKD